MIEIRARRVLGAVIVEADIAVEARTLALIGPSGGGKTTLLNMIAGLERPNSGRIAIAGETLFDSQAGVDLSPQARRLGYVFQEPRLLPHYTVAGNLRYGARRAGAALIGFEEVVARLGIGALLKRRPAKLSGGEKQRVAIGRALLSSPRALLLDEPLTALDPARREELIALVASLRDRLAIPILLVSHRHDEVERLADAVVEVSPGAVTRLR